MAINEKGPNISVDQFSRTLEEGVETLGNLSLADGKVGRYVNSRLDLLRESVTKIDQPILKGLAEEMLTTMSSWFNNPETLCCIIQGIWVAWLDSQDFKNNRILTTDNLTIGDTTFEGFIDKLVSFIDLIIIFISRDIQTIVFFIPDFIKEIFSSLMGAILLVMQETLFALRDSALGSLLEWIDDKAKMDRIWARCLPMQNMLDILKRYVHDYGLLAELNEKIRSWISGVSNSFRLSKELIPNVRDIEYLYWLRDLLLQLKKATINFDLCIEYEYIPNETASVEIENSDVISINNKLRGKSDPTGDELENRNDEALSLDDATIVVNEGKTSPSGNDPQKSRANRDVKGAWRSRINRDSVINFGVNYLGYPKEVLENAYTKYTENDLGDNLSPLSDVLDRCPGFTREAQLFGFRRG